ncbi:MAG: AMP-binding protein [Pseudomonadales bacterium]|nr:AMP-binding protein [Pseudomonadales bacterium]
MLYVDDNYYDSEYFELRYQQFDQHPILSQCKSKRFAVCLEDVALWIALSLYLKAKGGSVFPMPVDTPVDAARRRAQRSQCHYLLFGEGESDLDQIETITERGGDSEPVLVQTSSGTTGEPKFIERAWQSIDVEIAHYVEDFSEANAMTPVVACPVTHSYGLICGVLVALQRGVEPVVIKNSNPKYIIRKLTEVDAPILYSSPTLISTITMLVPAETPIHAVMTSGTLMQKAWFDTVKQKVTRLYQQYGCSEAGCIALGQDIQSVSDIGKPLSHLSVTAGQSCAEPAEIVVTKDDGQVIRTQDLGYFDQHGSLHFVARMDDMINVSGFNVYPAEVEEVVLELPQILDAVVFKRRHQFGNDQVCLNYVLDPTRADQNISEQDIREWCRRHLASHQIPMHIQRVDAVPKLPNGKISRKKLTDAMA